MRVIPIESSDDAAFRQWHGVRAAVQAERNQPEGPDPFEWMAALVRCRPAHEPAQLWLAIDGDRPVGAIFGRWWDAEDNRHRLDVEADFTVPAGPDVLTPIADFARSIGRSLLGLGAMEGSALDGIGQTTGAKLGQVEVRNVVRLAEVDPVLPVEPPPGYSVVAFDDPCPQELLEPFAALRTAMNDAPRGELAIEDFVITPERLRDGERARRGSGRTRWIVCARHDATDDLVAFTELEPSQWRPRLVEQGDTVVVQGHRGHGLGMLVKSVNLLRLLAELPEAEAVETWNADDNEHMLRVNRALGFRPRERWLAYELPLSDL